MGELRSLIPLISLLFFCAIIFTLRALDAGKKAMMLCAGIALAATILGFVFRADTAVFARGLVILVTLLIYILFMIVSITLIIRKIFAAKKVTQDTVIGGVCVYMLIGYLYACIYYVICCFDAGAFVFPPSWNHIYMFYFSLTTLTTVGYGDVYPVNRLAMVFSNLEAVTGQMYLGVFIARLVGLHMIHQYGSERQKT